MDLYKGILLLIELSYTMIMTKEAKRTHLCALNVKQFA